MTRPHQPPTRNAVIGLGPEPDLYAPAPARICDYLLGGICHYPLDQAAAARLLAEAPDLALAVTANRAFLRRAIRFLLQRGVRQYLDLGSGFPTLGSVHEIVHGIDPTGRVVYADNDPLVVDHALRILGNRPHVGVHHADLRSPGAVLGAATVLDLLDLTRPVGLILSAVGHFVADSDDLPGILAAYRSILAAGSHLVLSHATGAHLHDDQVHAADQVYRYARTRLTLRTPEQIAGLFAGFELLPPADDAHPAVVPVGEWRSADELRPPDHRARGLYGGVGYLPSPSQY